MQLSSAQVELAQLVADEQSVEFLNALDTWISNSFANRNEHTEITYAEWHSMFYIYEIQKLIRDIQTEHYVEKSFLENHRPADSLPDDVWEVINTVEHMFEELDAKKGKVTPGTYKHLMKATSVVISKYRA